MYLILSCEKTRSLNNHNLCHYHYNNHNDDDNHYNYRNTNGNPNIYEPECTGQHPPELIRGQTTEGSVVQDSSRPLPFLQGLTSSSPSVTSSYCWGSVGCKA